MKEFKIGDKVLYDMTKLGYARGHNQLGYLGNKKGSGIVESINKSLGYYIKYTNTSNGLSLYKDNVEYMWCNDYELKLDKQHHRDQQLKKILE